MESIKMRPRFDGHAANRPAKPLLRSWINGGSSSLWPLAFIQLKRDSHSGLRPWQYRWCGTWPDSTRVEAVRPGKGQCGERQQVAPGKKRAQTSATSATMELKMKSNISDVNNRGKRRYKDYEKVVELGSSLGGSSNSRDIGVPNGKLEDTAKTCRLAGVSQFSHVTIYHVILMGAGTAWSFACVIDGCGDYMAEWPESLFCCALQTPVAARISTNIKKLCIGLALPSPWSIVLLKFLTDPDLTAGSDTPNNTDRVMHNFQVFKIPANSYFTRDHEPDYYVAEFNLSKSARHTMKQHSHSTSRLEEAERICMSPNTEWSSQLGGERRPRKRVRGEGPHSPCVATINSKRIDSNSCMSTEGHGLKQLVLENNTMTCLEALATLTIFSNCNLQLPSLSSSKPPFLVWEYKPASPTIASCERLCQQKNGEDRRPS
ncbi:uncharacterized protein BDR25DRAFT_358939 [Lindgomyces ingoldianus]|uniref:Uncharacterized protein n=1 Tax=Lindgomyces ingoldianus TaxID=673940 RepID=A0ACB6QIW3_9PLEO|nr:uncharacterized protein BDR25DRAFT_358939 [Lindgomyces ingoldianus]KAF2466878.1 hypothetical protein BDR25DRAFT_358939 [Lindgomyces ingoldianus]